MDIEKTYGNIQDDKANGKPYAELFDKEYTLMSKEEREKIDAIMDQLSEILGPDEE